MNTVAVARQQTVTISVGMLCALVLYGLASSIFLAVNGNITRMMPQGILTPSTVIYVTLCIASFSLAFNSFFIYQIFKGKNWARIVYLVLFLLSAMLSIKGYVRMFFILRHWAIPWLWATWVLLAS